MIQSQVFPDYAVKQAFHDAEIERADDAIVCSMQNELVTRCLTSILKGAVISCNISKHKYLSRQDIEYGTRTSLFPFSTRSSKDVGGYLLDTRAFGTMCVAHIDLLLEMLQRHGIEASPIKISADVLLILQECVERLMRGFIDLMVHEGGESRLYGFRLFDAVMRKVTGDRGVEHDVGFAPVGSGARGGERGI